MNAAEIDWGYMKGALLAFAVCALLGGGLYWLSWQYADGGELSLKRENSRLQSSRRRYQTLDEEEKIIADYLPRFVELEQAGLVGRERRLDWIETLRGTAQRLAMPAFRYSIDSQREFEFAQDLEIGKFSVFASRMQLDLGLLHEGDLFSLLETVESEANGLFMISGCNLRRSQENLDMGGTVSNLSALCSLDWLTLRKRANAEDQS